MSVVWEKLGNPRRAIFVKQQNNAINQQINNINNPELNFEIPKKVTNELFREAIIRHWSLE